MKKTFTVDDEKLEAFERILLLAKYDAIAEVKRLNVLATAYWDRPAGKQGSDENIKRVEDMRDVALSLLEQLK